MKLPSHDSIVYTLGIVVSVIMTLATFSDTALASVGIPLAWAPYVRLASLVLGIASGKGATPYKDGNGAAKFGGTILLIAMLGGLTMGCAKLPVVTDPTLSRVSPATLIAFANNAKRAGEIASAAQQVEIGFYRMGRVPPATHGTIQQGFLTIAEAMKETLTIAQRLGQEQKLSALVSTVANALNALAAQADVLPDTQARDSLIGTIAMLRMLLNLPTPAPAI